MQFFLLVLLLPLLASAKLKDQLWLFFELSEQDSILKVEQTGFSEITVELIRGSSSNSVREKAEVPPKVILKLKEQADKESFSMKLSSDFTDPTQNSIDGDVKVSIDNKKSARESSSMLRKNRFKYVSTQTMFSSYVYGSAVPIALEMSGDKAVAAYLLALPISFGTHYFLSRHKEYGDSHLFATGYFGINSLFFSYVTPFILLGPDFNAFRTGSFAVLAAYPLGLYMGYKHGEHYRENPGRVLLQSSFSGVSGVLGLTSSLLWLDNIESEKVSVRLLLSQVMAAAVGGHYLSYLYRDNERVPQGIGPGITTHAVLGAAVSGTIMSYGKSGNLTTASLLLTSGIGAGFLEGTYFFRNKYDSYERASYSALGLVGGAMLPMGILALSGFPDLKVTTTLLTAGAFAGYIATRYFTQNLVEDPLKFGEFQSHKEKRLSFSLVPYPEPYEHRKEVRMRLKVPFLEYRFN